MPDHTVRRPMPGNKSPNRFRPRAHRYALEPRQMYDGAALVEAAHHSDPANAAHEAGKFQSPATEQPGHAAPAVNLQPAPASAPAPIQARTGGDEVSSRAIGDATRDSVAAGALSVTNTGK